MNSPPKANTPEDFRRRMRNWNDPTEKYMRYYDNFTTCSQTHDYPISYWANLTIFAIPFLSCSFFLASFLYDLPGSTAFQDENFGKITFYDLILAHKNYYHLKLKR